MIEQADLLRDMVSALGIGWYSCSGTAHEDGHCVGRHDAGAGEIREGAHVEDLVRVQS